MSDIKENDIIDNKDSEPKKKEVNKMTILLIIIIVLLVLIVGGIFFIIFNPEAKEKFKAATGIGGSSNDLDLDLDSVVWQGDESGEGTSNSSTDTITIPGYPLLEFPVGENKVTCNFINPEGNPCYFKFTLILDDTGEILTETKMVPPGSAVTDCELKTLLDAGEYAATIKIDTFELESIASLNGANVKTKVVVK